MANEPLGVMLDASALPKRPAGAGIYTLELARALAERGDVRLLVAAPWDTGAGEHVQSPHSNALARNAWEQAQLPRAAMAGGARVIHGAHFTVPIRAAIPRIATVHDLTFFRLPRRYGMVHRWYYRAIAQCARAAERIIVPSRAVASDAARYLGYAPERIRVIPEAPRVLPIAAEPAVTIPEEPYLLCVGTAEPGKRAVDAVRALAAMPAGRRPLLVLAGNAGPLMEPLRREAERLGVSERVTMAGYVDDGTLGALMRRAAALVYPSLYEGFGLPPLEAMALGTPVIASKAPAMDEVLGEAAVFVPPRDPGGIALAAMRLIDDESWRQEMVERGRERAGEYSWTRAAEETVAVYREVAA